MLGDTEKSTSWGTGIEQQKQGYLTFTAEDDLTMWEEAITADLIRSRTSSPASTAALREGRPEDPLRRYQIGRNGGWLSKNDIRGLEDMNPIEGGDDYDAPLNSNAVRRPRRGPMTKTAASALTLRRAPARCRCPRTGTSAR
jgi:phage portal protein BeeE